MSRLSPVFDQERKIKDEEDRESKCLHLKNVPGPGREHIQQGGEVWLARHEKVIAANCEVDEEHGDHVDIRPDKNTFEGLQSGSESFDDRHVNGDVDQQPVRDEGLQNSIMWEVVGGVTGRRWK